MYNFTVPMALMDFLPVVFFGITAVMLLGDLYHRLSGGSYVLLAAGSVNVFLAGFCKALWKLLYAAGICNFTALEEMFMPVNSLGLLFVGMSLMGAFCRKPKTAALSVAPPVFAGSAPFIAMMVLGLGGMCAGLSVVAVRMKKTAAAALFAVSFLLAMAMGYLSGQDSTLAWVNWAEQSINTGSQLCLLLGTAALHRAGLKDWKM